MVQCVGGRTGFWLFLAAVIWFLVNIDVIFLFFIGLFGGCFWNSGIFFCKANKMLNEISNHDKKTFLNSIKAIKKANKDLDFLRLSRKYFSQTISKPIDKSVLENSKDVVLKSFKVGWNDVGSWPSIYNLSKKNPTTIKHVI